MTEDQTVPDFWVKASKRQGGTSRRLCLCLYIFIVFALPVLFLNDEYRLLQPGGMESYFLSLRHRMYFLWCSLCDVFKCNFLTQMQATLLSFIAATALFDVDLAFLGLNSAMQAKWTWQTSQRIYWGYWQRRNSKSQIWRQISCTLIV